MCRKCGGDWGSPANKCFVRDHNLVSIQSLERTADQPGETQEDGEDEPAPFIPASKAKSRGKKIQKVVEILERYPQIITYHMI